MRWSVPGYWDPAARRWRNPKQRVRFAAADTVLLYDAAEGVAEVQISQLGLGARVNTLAARSMGSAVDAKPATGLTSTARPSAAPTVLVGVPVAAPAAMD